jgi:hypothetical protein
MKIIDKNLNILVDKLIEDRYSMVAKELFESIYIEKDKIHKLDGSIVECGVFKGGMSLFLAKLFNDKEMWLVDSFELGFPDPNEMLYKTDQVEDPHKKGYPVWDGLIGAPIEGVKNLFTQYGEGDNPKVHYLEGYVADTLNPKVCPIDKIALLRIDVDSYSGTTEVLEYLYSKVVSGGMIIFDDANIPTGKIAIEDWFEKQNIPLFTYTAYCEPSPGPLYAGVRGPGCYLFKP